MPKDYKNIKPKQKVKSGNTAQLKYFIYGLTVGLCVAIIVYFYQHNLVQQIQTAQPNVTVENSEPESDTSDNIPSPSFVDYEFYEILPNMEVNVSEWEAEDNEDIEEKSESTEEKPEIYVIQIASFKQASAANEVKAKLALIGITAHIQRVVINGKDVRHRIRVGPYAESDKLSNVRQQLAENNLSYLLLKLK